MSVTIDLKPEDEDRLRELAAQNSLDTAGFIRRLVEDRLAQGNNEVEDSEHLNDFDEQLVKAGVRLGNRKRSIALIESWMAEDNSDEDPAEWEQILRNIEEGDLKFRRVDA